MGNPTRLAQDSAYVDGAGLPANWWPNLDTAQQNLLNGDVGGTWSPAGAFSIAGAGMWCAGPWSLNSTAELYTTLGSGDRITHGDSDYIELATGHIDAVRTPITDIAAAFRDISGGAARMVYYNPSDAVTNYVPSSGFLAGGRILVELDVHNGAQIAFVNLTWFVGQNHGSLPQSQPMFRIYKVDAFGNVTGLKSTGLVAAGGWIQNADSTAAAYYNSGNAKVLQIVPDAGTVVDTTQFAYFAEIVDEQGTNAMSGNIFSTLSTEFAAIPDLRPQ